MTKETETEFLQDEALWAGWIAPTPAATKNEPSQKLACEEPDDEDSSVEECCF